MSGFDNDVVFAKNADFTSADNQSVSESNGLITNGQLWIGSTALNAGLTHINVGTLTSPNSSITIGYSSPNITLVANTSVLDPWTDVTTATQVLAVRNGYVTDRGAGVTYTLPATATFGDRIQIDGKLGLTTIAQNANQAIRMSSALSTTGVSGSVAGTNVGDCITLRCTTGGASTIWIAENFVGNWTVS